MTAPCATVVIPVYNQAPDLLENAITSAVRQTVPVEVVVVDDGSTEPVRVQPPARLIRHETNRGISAALNTGINAASANWIAWCSSDDELAPEKVEYQRQVMDAAGALAGYHAYAVYQRGAHDGDSSIYHRKDGQFFRSGACSVTMQFHDKESQDTHLARFCCINGSTTLIHRRVFETVGLFDEAYRYGQDYEAWCRVGKRYRWHAAPCPNPDCQRTGNVGLYDNAPSRRIREDGAVCEACQGFGVAILGSRRQGGNLTAQIDASPELRKVRDAEDRRIHKEYRAL